jgi:ATP-dependent DNA helicase RecG
MTKLKTPIAYLKGVGPARAELLQQELGIFFFEDLLYHFPFRHIDRSVIHSITSLIESPVHVQVQGRITNIKELGQGKAKRLTAKLQDETGSIELVWFKGAKWFKKWLEPNKSYLVYGRVTSYNRKLNIAHPEMEESNKTKLNALGLQSVYPLTEKLKSRKIDHKVLGQLIDNLFAIKDLDIPNFIPEEIRQKTNIGNRKEQLYRIHKPRTYEDVQIAQYYIKFEELFTLQMGIQKKRLVTRKIEGVSFEHVGKSFNAYFHDVLKFELTQAQKRVIKEIRQDMRSGFQMNRLLQGDVGSGKSIVAVLTMLIAIDNGFQCALMAPTEILAQQHFEGFQEELEHIGVRSALLTGSVKGKARKEILAQLEAGEIHILFGTHALIEDPVIFNNLGYVVIDEQHRFGVAQRARLHRKGSIPPHVLVMTATPIPRTLAMTIYGDLEVSVIDELPGGRKPIKTAHRWESNRLAIVGFLKRQIKEGRQVYVVFPLIEESETLDYQNLLDGFDHLLHHFPRPEFQVGMLHGKMSPADKEAVMERFKNNEIQILASTTVIEVGVNVPNATVMVIENAEKFGLAQLHQLRGRVGRGGHQSYCILRTGNKLSDQGRERIGAMVRTTDGFELAEIDLKLRGPGDLEGTQQSGLLALKMASIVHDSGILQSAKISAFELLKEDPNLLNEKNRALRMELNSRKGGIDWSTIS